MKRIHRRLLGVLCVAVLLATLFSGLTVFAAAPITTHPTGYTSADDVVYTTYTEGKTTLVANWGARGETCTFLSPRALAYYTESISYDTLSALPGGTDTADAPKSVLYAALAAQMKEHHTYINNYQETRYLYRYTDCVSGDIQQFSSFYSGTMYDGTWVGGSSAPWNREHTWPNSKGMEGSDEDDLMMLRPTLAKENGSRGNKAYGESTGFFDPGESVRGDVARITLYIYTRWGNTAKMWGKDGVMESLDVLLRWMEEDPVDTWEMGRNDVVESVTGVRNVFVDYPEYAWLLFGRDIPADMLTPSGIAATPETVTEALTEAQTQAPIEVPTEVPTETLADTTLPETPTESHTEVPTEPVAESHTVIPTEPPTAIPEEPTSDAAPIETPSTEDASAAGMEDTGCTSVVFSGVGLLLLASALVMYQSLKEETYFA